MVLLGSQEFERLLLRYLDVDAHAVGIAAGLCQHLLRGTGDGLQVDVAVEAVQRPEVAHDGHQPLHRVVGRAHHTARQKQSLDVVAAIELHHDLLQFRDAERGSRYVVGAAVHAVGAVVAAVVGEHHLEQRDAAPVVGKRVADAHAAHGIAHHALLAAPHGAAGGARHVVLRRLCENAQPLHGLFRQHRVQRYE